MAAGCGEGRLHKQDLIGGLQLMLKKRELGFRSKLASTRMLTRELGEMEERMTPPGRVDIWGVARRAA